MIDSVLYYEVHVTIEPVIGSRLDEFKKLCKQWGFRVADLLMVKNRGTTAERSDKDQFCTGRFNTNGQAMHSMKRLVADLGLYGFQVWRYKIEAVIFDKRVKHD